MNILILITLATAFIPAGQIITVNGPVDANRLGRTLAHEHVLVDFIGADKTNENRWNKTTVLNKVVPYFMEAKKAGVQAVVECTPAFLGRDVRLLKMLSDKTGINFITNTGYYGARSNKHLPSWAFTETAEQLAARWIAEFEHGIDGTGIKPGFIKISVDGPANGLTEVHKKLVRAAAITHLKTGLIIYSHTGPARAAFEQLEILKEMNVKPDAFVWVHAQAEKDKTMHIRAAKMGAWISLDNIGVNNDYYLEALAGLKEAGLLHRVLLSHDAGYYRPGEPDGGDFRGYTEIFQLLKGFSAEDIEQLIIKNPAEALTVKKR
ncbi:phosphotriesterase family protein [Chitinophaga niabensis]|uniref:Phosphotriesterase-related protein n=1 Tax=Chitinophaga niabensis TaxID=536979 RepID=A0A1N6K7J8_9BACT|nr:aryldialkylphosphatase [Chitinophaga niabensis]SIO52297.1 phosphotriesterase-related protein [Chitinophaga niabensis]